MQPVINFGYRCYSYLGSWYSYFVEEESTLTQIKKTNLLFQKRLENLDTTFKDITSGVLNGVSSNGPGESNRKSLYDKVWKLITDGVSKASVHVLQEILNNCQTFDLNKDDRNLKQNNLKILKEAIEKKENLKNVASQVWEQLNSYHIFCGGWVANTKTSSSKALKKLRAKIETKRLNGVNPIDALGKCHERWRLLFLEQKQETSQESSEETSSHPIPTKRTKTSTKEEIESLNKLIEETNAIKEKVSEKIIHFSTMYAIHILFKRNINPSIYNKCLKEKDVETSYLNECTHDRASRFVYKYIYRIIHSLMHPLIDQTIKNLVDRVGEFLNDDKQFKEFAKEEIKELANYFGLIYRAVPNFLNQNMKDGAGIFSTFLENSIELYGNKYTKEELIKFFGEYIVKHYIPHIKVRIKGHHIPIFSPLAEKMIHLMLKAIVRNVLKKTEIVQQILIRGTESVDVIQLELKKILHKKLQETLKMIDKYYLDKTPNEETKKEMEARKSQRIDQLHDGIVEETDYLLRFIDIIKCNGNPEKLKLLIDNPISNIVKAAIHSFSSLANWEPTSLQKIIVDATAELTEIILFSFFENKQAQIKTLLQAIFTAIDASFEYVPPDKKDVANNQLEFDITQIDNQLNELIKKLSKSGLDVALKNHYKNVKGEKHLAIKRFVLSEQKKAESFTKKIGSIENTIKTITKKYCFSLEKQQSKKLEILVNTLSRHILDYLEHISATLSSQELETCYSDVIGDLHNAYALTIHRLNKFSQTMEKVIQATKEIQECEDQIIQSKGCVELVKNISKNSKLSVENVKKNTESISQNLPLSMKEENKKLFEKLFILWKSYQEKDIQINHSDYVKKVEEEKGKFQLQVEEIKNVEKKLNNLSTLIRQYYDLRKNRRYPTEELVEKAKKETLVQINNLYLELMNHPDLSLQEHALKYLNSADTDKLYRLFYPSWVPKQAPIFSLLNKYKAKIEKEISTLQKKINCAPPKEGDIEKLKKEHQQDWKAIQDLLGDMKNGLELNEIQEANKIEEKLAFIANSSKKFKKLTDSCLLIFQELDVKGLIVVGELQFLHTFTPEITAHIYPMIEDSTLTALKAMNDRFHYEQIALRLFLLKFAKLHKPNHKPRKE